MHPGAATIRTSPPRGVSRSAFSTRLETTCSTRSASAIAGEGPSRRRRQRDAEGFRLRPVAGGDVGGDLGQVDLARMDGEVGAVHPGEVEQVADESPEPLGLGGDRLRRLLGADRPVAQRLRVAGDRGQRRLQLVADREQERALRLARPGELLGEVVERDARASRARPPPRPGPAPDACLLARSRLASATRATGRAIRRASTKAATAASRPPASAAITIASTKGVQRVPVRLFGRSRMNARP